MGGIILCEVYELAFLCLVICGRKADYDPCREMEG